MISYEEANRIISENAKLLSKKYPGEELVPIEKALGRVLARDIVADRDYPPFNRSAMDGFAIQLEDWEGGIRSFKIIEVIFAGQESKKSLSKGECYKIMTGAALPSDANTVVRREDTIEKDSLVNINIDDLRVFQNIAKQGEDTKKEDVIIQASEKCTPSVISALATTGYSSVMVKALPKVSLFTTGNEVVNVNEPASAVQIRNSNQHLLKSLLHRWNIVPVSVEHLPDEKGAIEKALKNALQSDIVILSGGVSAGDADFIPDILQLLGVTNLFYKVAIRPGKPIWCGILPSGGMVFALPGNPFSTLVTFTLFVERYLHEIFFSEERPVYSYPLTATRFKKHKLTEFFPVKLEKAPAYGLTPIQFNGSGDIRAGLFADGLAIQASEKENLKGGELVNFIPFK